MKNRVEVQKFPELLEEINRELEAGNAVEIRRERDELVVVRLGRTVKLKVTEKSLIAK